MDATTLMLPTGFWTNSILEPEVILFGWEGSVLSFQLMQASLVRRTLS